jgi:hypothetical protein
MKSFIAALLAVLCLCQCGSFPLGGSTTVYALAEQDELQPAAADALHTVKFLSQSYKLAPEQREALTQKFAQAEAEQHLLLIGRASAELPPEYARMLGQRRAEAVRQLLIDLGWPPNHLHPSSRGNDDAPGQRSDTVTLQATGKPKDSKPAAEAAAQ